jgi:NAD(P)-dependent dehydrogenase (short-subunit alcohol dehydrogenase family)
MNLAQLLTGKSVLITGGSSGLGEHFARLCARSGARVAITGRRAERLALISEELLQIGAAQAAAIPLDVRDSASVRAALAAATAQFGHLHVLVNNAGIAMGGAALDQSEEAFDAVMGTNLKGVWLLSVEAARQWKREGQGGIIVNVASIAGLRPAGGLASYAVSKAGVVQLTKTLALEWARYGIRVNALAPGYIETELNSEFLASEAGQALIRRIPMRRVGRLEELDAPFLLLATEASSLMTGSILVADGGHLTSSL